MAGIDASIPLQAQAPQPQNQLNMLMQLLQFQQGTQRNRLLELQAQREAELQPTRILQAQAEAAKTQGEASKLNRLNQFYSPENMQKFMQPSYGAVAPVPDELGGGPSRAAGPMTLDYNRLSQAGIQAGAIDLEKLMQHQATQAQAKASLESLNQQRQAEREARYYDINTRSEDRQASDAVRSEDRRRHDDMMREVTQSRQREQDARQLNQKHQEFTQRLTKEGIPSIYSTIDKIDSLLTPYLPAGTKASDQGASKTQGKDIPGLGMLDKLTPGFLLSSEAQDIRQNVQSLANAILKMRSGSAVTNYEERRVLQELGSGKLDNESQVLKGIQLIKRVTDAEAKNIGAGFDDKVLQTHEERTGMKIPRNRAAPAGLPAGSSLIGKTPDGKDVYQSPDGKKWVP